MCLAVPGKVIDVHGDDPFLRTARVSFAGVIKNVSLACAPEAQIGDYVLVHVGVAISIVDQKEAEETYAYLKDMGELDGLDADPAAAGRQLAAVPEPTPVGRQLAAVSEETVGQSTTASCLPTKTDGAVRRGQEGSL